MATYEQVTYNSPDGAQIGTTSTELIAFFGATPVAQPSGASQAAVSTAAATSGSAIYGFTSAQANGIISLLNQLRSDAVTLGLIKGS
jgi:hypothetical protein